MCLKLEWCEKTLLLELFRLSTFHIQLITFLQQLLKKLLHCGDTSCLRPLLAVVQQKDRMLLHAHCHAAAKNILEEKQDRKALRDAVAYLSIAIMASGELHFFSDNILFPITHLNF